MSGKVIEVQFSDLKKDESKDIVPPAPPASALLNEMADLVEAGSVPVERVDPERAETMRKMAETTREVAAEVEKVESAWDRVKKRADEFKAWATRVRGTPLTHRRVIRRKS